MKREEERFVARAQSRLESLAAEIEEMRHKQLDAPRNEWELLERVAAGEYENAKRLLDNISHSGRASEEERRGANEALDKLERALETLTAKADS